MAPRKLLYVVLGSLLLIGFFLSQFGLRPDSRPDGTPEDLAQLFEREDVNVLFILIDTLRSDRLGSYGYSRETSPTLDELARFGIRFDQHFAQSSWTKTSMASIWTASYPNRTGIFRFDDALPETALLPAEILRDAGFVTAGIWRNGWVAPTFGFEQGFEVYHRPQIGALIDSVRRESDNPYAKIAGSDLDLADGTVEFLRAYRDQRFFLYLHLMDVHQYLSDEESAIFGTSYSDLYDNSILWTDRQIATILGALERFGIRDNTLVVVASDHGEAFQEHGREGHAKDLHREVIRTPWIISLPFALADGIVVDAMTENVDVWPTLLDLLGLGEMHESDGATRLPDILAAADAEGAEPPVQRETSFAHIDRTWGKAELESDPLIAVKTDHWRYIKAIGPRPDAQLYDLDVDPEEKKNLLISEAAPLDVADFEALIERYQAMPDPEWRADVLKVELDDMQKGQLRAIGYSID